jgi:mono/diheme cytochrome c family protein
MTKVSRALVVWCGVAVLGTVYLQLHAAPFGVEPAPGSTLAPLNLGAAYAQAPSPASAAGIDRRAILAKYCFTCHNERVKSGGLVLDKLDLDAIGPHAETWEKVVAKLGARAMPPPRMPRPDEATYRALTTWLETELDQYAAAHPNPGMPTIHRLNRVEYTNAIRDLLALEIDGPTLLPPDDSGYGFDNNGDVLSLSPLLMERYMLAARKISRLAIGDATYTPYVDAYKFLRNGWQLDRMGEDLPFGSRGGMAIRRNFSLDGEYVLRIKLQRTYTNARIRGIGREEKIEIRVNGERVRVFTIGGKFASEGNGPRAPRPDLADERLLYEESADDALVTTFPVKAGMHTITASFVKQSSAAYEGVGPQNYPVGSVSDLQNDNGLMQIDTITIGPETPAGSGDTASRRQIFTCRPASATTTVEEVCAKAILSKLATKAYRRPAVDQDVQTLMAFYREARKDGTFEIAIGAAIERLLVSPEFIFRIERNPPSAKQTASIARISTAQADVEPARGTAYRISDLELASRLSFFIWSSIPDEPLLEAAQRGRLKDPKVLEQQVRRMLADPRATELMKNFGGQWLMLRNVRFATPDPDTFPEFDDNLREAMQRETEMFLENLMREDRSVLDLVNANYTFVNERLARHYGLPNVYGTQFRRVTFPDDKRGGLLGMASIQLVTSQATRTSPVQRGKWVLENLLGTPPPAPPANVPPFPDNGDMTKLSVRKRMEMHRQNAICASCHNSMDPLGFALENFDAVGKWRTTEGGNPIDASGSLPDGTTFSGPAELRKLVGNHREQFVRTLTHKLMTYALGRGVEHYDLPAIRKAVREAAPSQYKFSALVLGIVKSVPFQQRLAPPANEELPAQRLN